MAVAKADHSSLPSHQGKETHAAAEVEVRYSKRFRTRNYDPRLSMQIHVSQLYSRRISQSTDLAQSSEPSNKCLSKSQNLNSMKQLGSLSRDLNPRRNLKSAHGFKGLVINDINAYTD